MTALAPAAALALAVQCAPGVSPTTMRALMATESGLDPYAIHTNNGDGTGRSYAMPNEPAAVALVQALVREGRAKSIDAGLAQINSLNWSRLGLSIETVFDKCRNIAAGARVLTEGWQRALRVAFSYYNTGSPDRGFGNGYVRSIERAAARVPAIQVDANPAASPPADGSSPLPVSAPPDDTPAIYGRPVSGRSQILYSTTR